MFMRKLPILIFIVLLAATGGCLPPVGDPHLSGAEMTLCDEVRTLPSGETSGIMMAARPAASTRRQKVLLALCEEPEQVHEQSALKLPEQKDAYHAIATRNVSAIDIGTFVISTAIETAHNLKDEPPTHIGMALAFERLLDNDALEAEFAAQRLPNGVLDKYRKLLALSKTLLQRQSKDWTPDVRELVLELPARVASETFAQARVAPAFEVRLAQLTLLSEKARSEKRVEPNLVQAFTTLRDEAFAARGGTIECTYHPFFMDLTRELALVHLATGDNAGFTVESRILTGTTSMRGYVQHAIFEAQMAAAKVQTEKHNERAEAKETESKVKSRLGSPKPAQSEVAVSSPKDIGEFFAVTDSEELKKVLLKNGAVESRGQVESNVRQKEGNLLKFRTRYQTETEDYNCHEINDGAKTVISVSRRFGDGSAEITARKQMETHTECSHRDVRVALPTPAPQLFFGNEAIKIQPGEFVAFARSEKKAYVAEVYVGDPMGSDSGSAVLKQWRNLRFSSATGSK
jgi:hypothetical protein